MRIVFAIPGDLNAASGGYAYDRALFAHAPALGVELAHLALPARFPFPTAQDVETTLAHLRAHLRPGDSLLIDGLAFGALPAAAVAAVGAPIAALCHHPLFLETGLSASAAAALFASEKAALSEARKVIVTSAHTAALVAREFSVPEGKIAVAVPGVERGVRAPRRGEPPVLLTVGALIARKGHDLLLDALAGVVDLPWRLRICGSPEAAPEVARKLFARAGRADLAGRIEFLGEVSAPALRPIFAGADIFVSASHYEGYGMALAEALSFGLPIVASSGGAAHETLPDAAALKVATGNANALRSALRLILTDRSRADAMAEAAWLAGQRLPDWRQTARNAIEAVLAA